MPLNWIDWIIIAVVGYHAFLGWQAGFFPLATSLVSFIAAIWATIAWQGSVSEFFTLKFGIVKSWSTVISYIAIAFVVQEIVSSILHIFIARIPKKIVNSKYSEWFGAFISSINGFIVTIFFLLLVLALPLRGTVKNDIRDSKIGGFITQYLEKYGGPVQSAIEDMRAGARKFFTIEPGSRENISLDVHPKSSELRVDENSEKEMLSLVNGERAKVGAPALIMDAKIVPVARAHSRDMFERSYFSHYSPEGTDAGDRMEKAGVSYMVAGENLAYAPDVRTAHQGLMDSPSHKKNILDPQFKRVGIGIITTDTYGMMVTQNFTN